MLRFRFTVGLAVLSAWVTTAAGQPPEDVAIDMAAMMKMAGGAKPGKSDKSPFPKFEDVTKDMESKKGLFTLWSYPAGAKDKDQEKLLAQIPAGFLGEKFMLSVSFSGGGFFTGFPLEERVVKWKMRGKQLVLVAPQTRYIVDKSNTLSDVVRRTYPERIRTSVSIVTKSPSGDPVIDLGSMLKSNFADIAWMSRGGLFGSRGGRGGGVNAALSEWTKKKTFELNVEIGVALAVGSSSPPGSYDKKMVHFSFWKLPKSDYAPRVADDRVGYFLTANQDWAKPTESRDIFNRYIDRWHLVKRDPSLALCEPKQPIIYYIEKTVPVRFRRAVRDGILDWNKAFRKIGFVNAVEVRQQTNDNEWKNLDPEDMRYSFFRWIVSGAAFAMGPHRANPFTGEIYDADIIFDDSMVRFFEHSAQQNLPSAAMAMKMDDPVVREFVSEFPQWKRPGREWESFMFGDEDGQAVREAMRERMRKRGYVGCDYAEGMKHQMSVASAVLAGQPKEVIDRFLYDALKEVVSHEVGHTLGLRHNFKASTIYSLDEIAKRRTSDQPTCGSVMDYNPVLFLADDATEGHFVTPSIGPYDYWAIEYGYRPADGSYKPKASDDEKKTPGAEDSTDARVTSDTPSDKAVSDIPKDVLAKLPPHVRKMLEAEAAKSKTAGGSSPKNASGPASKGPPAGEKGMLAAIASRSAEPELAYATDEDTTLLSPDPRSNRFDMAGDPIEWAEARLKLVNQRLDSILDWGVKDKESWYHLRAAFSRLMFEKVRVVNYVGRYIGGQYTSRSHRGDADAAPPFELVDVALQRKALAFIENNLYQEDFFSVSPEVLNHLAAPRWWHAGARIDFRVDFPIHRMISTYQWWNLFNQLFPNTLRRIYDAEMKSDARDKFTVAEYLQRMQDACWSASLDQKRMGKGKWTDASPYVSSVRRSLQREFLNLMEPLVRTPPGVVLSPDVHAMVQNSLRKLNKGVDGMLVAGGLDFASESHLVSCKSRIERMLEPKLDEYR